MEADPLEIAREAVAIAEGARLAGQATEIHLGHDGSDSGSYVAQIRNDHLATLAQALIAKHAEVGRLREALERLIPIMENASRDAFKNGVTDPTGSMDQGDVWACNAIDAARATLAQEAGK